MPIQGCSFQALAVGKVKKAVGYFVDHEKQVRELLSDSKHVLAQFCHGVGVFSYSVLE